ncbi:MAG: hypothetical protein ABI528_06995, partial [bacterium]
SVNLNGSPRAFIRLDGKELKDPSFLKGQFMISSNALNEQEMNSDFFAPYKKEIEKLNREIDSLQNFIDAVDTLSGDKYQVQRSLRDIGYAERNIGYARTKIGNEKKKMERTSANESYEIITKDNCVFVISQTDVTDQAKVLISKVKLNSDTTASLLWQTELKNVFRDPDKGMDKSSFEVVFSKGNPDLNTMRIISEDNKLIFAFMLKATCININTGAILWSIDM